MRIVFVQAIPKDAMGKIIKRKLRKHVLDKIALEKSSGKSLERGAMVCEKRR